MFFHYYFFQQQYRCAMFSYHVRHLIFESNLLSNSRFHSTSFINIFFLRKRYTNYFKQISEKNEKNDKFKVEFVDIESGVGRAIFFWHCRFTLWFGWIDVLLLVLVHILIHTHRFCPVSFLNWIWVTHSYTHRCARTLENRAPKFNAIGVCIENWTEPRCMNTIRLILEAKFDLTTQVLKPWGESHRIRFVLFIN